MDAATPTFYIAIKDDEQGQITERQYSHREIKGEALLSVVKEMFDQNGLDIHKIAYLCTTKGPGSLTGLRIAMSMIKTMAQILKVPIICMPTLYALERSYTARTEQKHQRIITCLMARKNYYYVRFSGSQEESFEQMSTERLCEKAKTVDGLLIASGPAALNDCDNHPLNSVIIKQTPEVIFNWCDVQYQKKSYQNYLDCQPEYAGKSVAEKNFENK